MSSTEISALIAELVEKQKDQRLTDAQFARRLGLSRQAWSALKMGAAEPSVTTLRTVARVFRDLKPRVWDFIMAEETAR